MDNDSLLDVGIIITNTEGIIVYNNSIASTILNENLVGREVNKVILELDIPSVSNKMAFDLIAINNREFLINSIKIQNTSEPYVLILLHDLNRATYSLPQIISLPIKNFLDFAQIISKKDLMFADGEGTILKINFDSNLIYQVKPEEIVGKSAFELDQQGILRHKATMKVVSEKKQVSVIHENKLGNKLLITGVPLFQGNETKYVISYGEWDFDLYDHILLEEKYRELQEENQRYEAEIKELRDKELQSVKVEFKSRAMGKVVNTAIKVAQVNTNVLICGESGVGKNVIAKLIHRESYCSKGPFISINCGAIPESLLESELFGYERGAFTGALQKGKIGKIEMAHGGTLFLDEIGELPLNMQVKLLDVIQEKKITKIGGIQVLNVDFRLIAATNKDLNQLVKEGLFRKDLFYRLNVVPINIPPLRERKDDLLLLILNILERANGKYGRNKVLSQDVIEFMMQCDWPGNIRELENFVERIVLMVEEDYIGITDLPDSMNLKSENKEETNLTEAIENFEGRLIQEAYDKYRTTVGVAKALGISQATAVRKIHKYVAETKLSS